MEGNGILQLIDPPGKRGGPWGWRDDAECCLKWSKKMQLFSV